MTLGFSPSSKQGGNQGGLWPGSGWGDESSSPWHAGRAPTWERACSQHLWQNRGPRQHLAPQPPRRARPILSRARKPLKSRPCPGLQLCSSESPRQKRADLRRLPRKRASGCSAQVQSSAKMLNYSSAGALSPSSSLCGWIVNYLQYTTQAAQRHSRRQEEEPPAPPTQSACKWDETPVPRRPRAQSNAAQAAATLFIYFQYSSARSTTVHT